MQGRWLALAVCVGLGTAGACADEGRILFEDRFETLSNDWGTGPDETQRAVDGRLVLDVAPNLIRRTLYSAQRFFDVDIRMTIAETAPASRNSPAGVIFWGDDVENHYAALIRSNGTFQVARRTRDRWLTVVDGRILDAIRRGVGQENTIRVTTRGSLATIYVNDQQVTSFRGYPPAEGGKIGVQAEADADPTMWAFANVVVRELPEEPTADSPPPDDILFSDAFPSLDPSWGLSDESVGASDGELTFKMPTKRVHRRLYWGRHFDDIDLRVQVRQSRGGDDQVAGAMFWAQDFRNYHAALLTSNGQLLVGRNIGGEFVHPAPARMCEQLRRGVGESNTLRIVTQGQRATIYVNDEQVATFRGFPPSNGSLIGMHCEAGDVPAAWHFADLSVRQPEPLPGEVLPADPGVLLADDFSTLDSTWGLPDEAFQIVDSALQISPAAQKIYRAFYHGGLFTAHDIRVAVTQTSESTQATAGLMFFGAGYGEHHAFVIDGAGNFMQRRTTGGQSRNVAAPRRVDAIKTGAGAVNQLRLVVNGRQATFYVNGVEVSEFQLKEDPPGKRIGVQASAGADPAVWRFDDFSIRGLE